MATQYDGYLRFGTALDNTGFERGVGSMTSAAKKGAKLAVAALATVTTGLGVMAAAAIKVGSDFEEGMSKVSAISGATGKDLEALTAKAAEMGAKTKFTATQSAEALQYMAMAGWKTEDMLNGLEGIMNLAAASGEDLGLVSDIVTDALTAFGLKAADSAHFADVLAKASSNSNTNVAMMGQTFKYAAPIAGALGYSIEDTAVAIGLMANAGIKADQAGTSLRSMMTRLSAPPRMAAKAIDELDLSITNADGTMKPFAQVMDELRVKFAGMSKEQQVANAKALAGQEAMSGLLAIVNASPADFEKLTLAVADADGAAEEMATTMQDNLKGQITILGSALEGLGITVYDKFEAPMRAATKSAIGSVNDLNASMQNGKLSASVDKLADATGNFVASAAELAVGALPKMINGLTWILDNGKLITATIGGVTAAVVTFKAVSVLTKVTAAWRAAQVQVALFAMEQRAASVANVAGAASLTAFETVVGVTTGKISIMSAVMAANPIGLLAVGVAALTAGLIIFNRGQDETIERSREIAKAVEDERISWEDRKAAIKDQIESNAVEVQSAKDMLTELESLVDANGKVGESKERVKYLTDEINKVIPDSIKWIGEETISYEKNIDAIRRQMEMKQAQIALEAMESERVQAKKDMADALNTLLEQEELIAQAELQLAEAKEGLSKAMTDSQRMHLERQIADKQNAVDELRGAFDTEKNIYEDKANWLQQYDQLAKAVADENYEAMNGIMTAMNLSLKDAKNANEQELKDQVAKLSAQFELLEKEFGTSTNEQIKQQKAEIERLLDENETELAARTAEVGAAMMTGIAKGIYSEQDKVKRAMSASLNAATDEGKKTIESHSPSKLTARVLGLPMPQGIAVGILSGAPLVSNALKSVVIGAVGSAVNEAAAGGSKLRDAFETMSTGAMEVVKSKAKNYKDVGSIYVEQMSKGINERRDTAIKAVEDQVEAMLAAEEKALEKGEEELQKRIENTKNKNAKKQLQDQLKRLKEQNDAEMKTLKTFGQDQVSAYTEAVKATAEEQIAVVSESVGALADEFQKKYDSIISQRDDLEKKLSAFGELYIIDPETNEMSLSNINDQIGAMEHYEDVLTRLKEKLQKEGLSEEFLGVVTSMGMEEGTKYGEELLSATDATFKSYITTWDEKQKLAKEIAARFYKDELDTLEKEFVGKLDKSLADVPKAVKDVGRNAMLGFIAGMESQRAAAVATARSIADEVKAIIQAAFEISSPSRWAKRVIGVNVIKGMGMGMTEGMEDLFHKMRATVNAETMKFSARVSVPMNYAALRQASKTITNHNDNGIVQNIAINQPVKSPSEMRRAFKKAGRELVRA